jgi:polyhydroxybutyrate depolymerase
MMGFVLLLLALVVLFVLHSRSNQELVLPPDGGTLPTTPPATPKGSRSLYSQTGIRQGDTVRQIAIVSPPDQHSGERLPAVIVLHGLNGSGGSEAEAGGWDAKVAEDRFIAVFPQGALGSWNAGGCCRPATTLGVEDVPFLDAIVTDLTRRDAVDPTRIYMVGDSNGGMETYAYLCQHADRLAGAASVTGTNDSGCQPNATVPLLHVAGTADEVVPYHGGSSAASVAFASGGFQPVPASVAAVAASEGCPDEPVTTAEGAVTTERWSDCRGGSLVQLVTIEGATHKWPVGAPYDATTEILRFFGIAP